MPTITVITMKTFVRLNLFFLILVKSVFAADYYIDPLHPNASNSNEGTSPTTPWRDWKGKFLDSYTAITAGDVIYFAGGNHQMTLQLNDSTPFSGVAGNPAIIRPYAGFGGSNDVVINGNHGPCLYSTNGDHDWVTLDGSYNGGSFTFTGCSDQGIELTGGGHTGWVLDGFTIEDSRSGIRLSGVTNTTISNFTIQRLFSVTNSYDSYGIAMRNECDQITITDGFISKINDTRGGDGDADGLTSTVDQQGDYGVLNAVVRRVHVQYAGEDGVDVRARDSLTLADIVTHHNAICGVKTWETSSINVYNVLTYSNGESGLKIQQSVGDIWHVTSIGNYLSGLNIRNKGCDVNIYNSIFAGNKQYGVDLGGISTGYTTHIDFYNTLIHHPTNFAVRAWGNARDFSNDEVADGTLNSALTATYSCSGCTPYEGTFAGSATDMIGTHPDVVKYPIPGKFIRSVGAVTTTSLTLESGYTHYPAGAESSAVGDYIESDVRYGWDGVNRRLTAVSGDNNEILIFAADPFPSTPDIGGWLVNWGQTPPADKGFDLTASSASSNIVDAGIYDPLVHEIFHVQSGLAPDIGYYEYDPGTTVVPGDVNGDSTVDLKDVILTLQVLTNCSHTQSIQLGADVDNDNMIDIGNALYLLDILSREIHHR